MVGISSKRSGSPLKRISRRWKRIVLGALKRLDDWQHSSSEPEPDEMDTVQYDIYLEELTKPRKKD